MTTDFGCGDQSRELEGNRKGSLVCETYPLEWQHRLQKREWMPAGNGYELSIADLRPTLLPGEHSGGHEKHGQPGTHVECGCATDAGVKRPERQPTSQTG